MQGFSALVPGPGGRHLPTSMQGQQRFRWPQPHRLMPCCASTRSSSTGTTVHARAGELPDRCRAVVVRSGELNPCAERPAIATWAIRSVADMVNYPGSPPSRQRGEPWRSTGRSSRVACSPATTSTSSRCRSMRRATSGSATSSARFLLGFDRQGSAAVARGADSRPAPPGRQSADPDAEQLRTSRATRRWPASAAQAGFPGGAGDQRQPDQA